MEDPSFPLSSLLARPGSPRQYQEPRKSALLVVLVRQPPLGVQSRRAPAPSRRHGLPVGVVHHVTRGEHTGNLGPGRRLVHDEVTLLVLVQLAREQDRKSTRLNSSHPSISYAVFCLKKKKISTS